MENNLNIVAEYINNNGIDTDYLDNLAQSVVKLLINRKLKLATAESLTGGMISQYITSVSGASEIFELGICSYTDRIKTQELFVSEEILDKYSAVSEQTAIAMAQGIMKKSSADIAVAVTGLAGPGVVTAKQPVGTVFAAVIYKDKSDVRNLKLYDSFLNLNREKIRRLTTAFAFKMIADII